MVDGDGGRGGGGTQLEGVEARDWPKFEAMICCVFEWALEKCKILLQVKLKSLSISSEAKIYKCPEKKMFLALCLQLPEKN